MDGKISRLFSDKGFGFIIGNDGQEYFVHRSAIRGEVFEQLREGQPVTFDATKGDKACVRKTFASNRDSHERENGA